MNIQPEYVNPDNMNLSNYNYKFSEVEHQLRAEVHHHNENKLYDNVMETTKNLTAFFYSPEEKSNDLKETAKVYKQIIQNEIDQLPEDHAGKKNLTRTINELAKWIITEDNLPPDLPTITPPPLGEHQAAMQPIEHPHPPVNQIPQPNQEVPPAQA
jgi:hypothetical protein